jgi:predicted aspartyl protease
MWFVVDTGSTWTFLDATKAKELNIATEGSRTVETGEVHALTMTFARDTTLEISGVKVPIQELAVMTLKFRHAPQLVGIIGSDLFERFVVEIDYAARSLELFEPNDYAYKGPGEILTMEVIEKIPHIVVNISRGSVNLVPAKLLVDTGAAQSVVLYAPFVETNKLLETTTGTILITAGGLGGGSLMRKVRAKVVKIGRLTFDRPLIYFAPQKRSAGWRDGILGNDLLDRFKVIIDYSRRRVILEPSARLNAPTDFSSYQFNLIREGKRYKVAEIVEGGIAGEAGLRTGDVLTSVNGNSVSDLSLFETQRLFLMDGQDRVLSVKRGDQTLEIKLRSFRID